MADQEPKKPYGFKKDRFAKNRGGSSVWLTIFCQTCKIPVLLYQKDGPGRLLRLYLDRIFAPDELADLQNSEGSFPNLFCPTCNHVIGTPMVYERENRRAYRLMNSGWYKKKTAGVFPPEENEVVET